MSWISSVILFIYAQWWWWLWWWCGCCLGVSPGGCAGLLGVPQLSGGSAQDRGLLWPGPAGCQLLAHSGPLGVRYRQGTGYPPIKSGFLSFIFWCPFSSSCRWLASTSTYNKNIVSEAICSHLQWISEIWKFYHFIPVRHVKHWFSIVTIL